MDPHVVPFAMYELAMIYLEKPEVFFKSAFIVMKFFALSLSLSLASIRTFFRNCVSLACMKVVSLCLR